MHTNALLTTLSLLSALTPASAEHWHKRHAHPAKVVVTAMETVIVQAGQPTPNNAAPQIVDSNVHVVNNPNNAPAAKPSSSVYVAPVAKPSSTQAAAGYKSTSSQAAPSHPSATGGTVAGGGGDCSKYSKNCAQFAGKFGGTVTFHNNCDKDVYLWVVNGTVNGERTVGKIPKGQKYSEPKLPPACDGCGTCFKVSDMDHLAPGNQPTKGYTLQFEYSTNMTDTKLAQYNDISFVDCATGNSAPNCVGWSQGLTIQHPNSCKPQYCAPGSFCDDQAYFIDVPQFQPSYTCGDNSNMQDTDFIICSGNTKKRSIAGRLEVDGELS